MNQIVFMAVQNTFDDLPAENFTSFFIQLALLLNVVEELSSFKVLHDDGYLHILEGEAVGDFHNVIMFQGF